MKATHRMFLTALALGLAGAAYAQNGLPPTQTYGSVSFITGGVGLDESAALKAAQKDYALSLLFVQTQRGEYLADVKVSIKDHAGETVLEAVSDGPMLLAKLPAGSYTVRAEHEGKVLVKTVRVAAKGVTRASFVWQATAKATIE
ncbi:MAG TPA: carboxypeptidase-like regulatory domain-containing protein [Burkholderiales bacterium]|nr:carboxypeptidase-like regulatory domain-containing protein [Burkholderiales bacterium]